MDERRVLVVDDDAATGETVAESLTLAGCTVVVASDGAEGVRKARSCDPSVVLVDLSMPRIDGWDLIRTLRSGSRSQRRIHIIVVSGHSDARSRQRAFEAGCDQYIVKADVESVVSAVCTRFDVVAGERS